jgi:Putative binding domain, N-terminal/Viral BACON domain
MVIRSSRVALLAATLLALGGAAGCGSSATTSTATAPTSINRCSVTVNGDGQVPAQGGSRSFSVSAARECAWSASAEAQWLTIKAGASGQGDGTVEVTAAANPDPQVRRGNVVLNEQRVELIQAAADCSYALSGPSSSFGQSGGSGTFDVRASSSLCAWTVSSDSPWITIRSGTSGTGTAAVQFEVAATSGAPRTGIITAAGLRFSVMQAAACTYAVAPRAHNVPTAGAVITIGVTTAADCPWTGTSSDPWIGVVGPASFVGSGTIAFNVTAVSGAARSGSVVVAGQSVSVSQAAAPSPSPSPPPPAPPPPPPACSYQVSPMEMRVQEEGRFRKIKVEAGAGCAWSASSKVPWIRVVRGASGSGDGEVEIWIDDNNGDERTGTLTVAGQTVTVTQRR